MYACRNNSCKSMWLMNYAASLNCTDGPNVVSSRASMMPDAGHQLISSVYDSRSFDLFREVDASAASAATAEARSFTSLMKARTFFSTSPIGKLIFATAAKVSANAA